MSVMEHIEKIFGLLGSVALGAFIGLCAYALVSHLVYKWRNL